MHELSPVTHALLPLATQVWTKLLKDGRDAGCIVVDGLQMFVGQAADQFKLFTGQEAPVELMKKTLEDAIAASAKK